MGDLEIGGLRAVWDNLFSNPIFGQVVYAKRTSYPGPFRECERAVLSFFFESCRKWSVDNSKAEKINNAQLQSYTFGRTKSFRDIKIVIFVYLLRTGVSLKQMSGDQEN